MPTDPAFQIEVLLYIEILQACFNLWLAAMQLLRQELIAEGARQQIIVAIEAIARAARELAQIDVLPPMAATHRAALQLLQAGIDALEAGAQGRGAPAIQEMQEQWTIFQMELYRLAIAAGLIRDA